VVVDDVAVWVCSHHADDDAVYEEVFRNCFVDRVDEKKGQRESFERVERDSLESVGASFREDRRPLSESRPHR